MGATITLRSDEDFQATIQDWVWTGTDPAIVAYLQSTLDPDGPSGSDPATDYHAALAAAEELGGDVIAFDLPVHVFDRTY